MRKLLLDSNPIEGQQAPKQRRKYSAEERKARRRIHRQIRTGVKQARVRQKDDNIFVYLTKHRGGTHMRFRVTKAERLILLEEDGKHISK